MLHGWHIDRWKHGMESILTRRRVMVGLTGLAAACWCGSSFKAFAAWSNPIPAPPQDADIASYVMDEVRELYRVTLDERAALAEFAEHGTGGKAWSRLHLIKVESACTLRKWTGRGSPGARELPHWLDRIYPADTAYAPIEGGMKRAWTILNSEPRTMADAALYRRAARHVCTA
jgi:hypothetical protein